jgi:hypothetical protein
MNKRRWETAVLHAGGFADVRDATRSITQRLAALLVVLFMLGLLHAATAAEIDTPEAHQPYGSRAKQALSDLAFSKDVRESQPSIAMARRRTDLRGKRRRWGTVNSGVMVHNRG